MALQILFIGGTGNISSACTSLALARGMEVWHLNRGQRTSTPDGVRTLTADIRDADQARAVLTGMEWDAVVNFIAFKPEDIERDLQLFRGRTAQYGFISSTSIYQKPQTHYLLTESTPLANPHWQYARDKIACEERLMRAVRDERFPAVIIRPSHTYGDTMIPLAINSRTHPYTVIDRMRRGLPVIVHGDGSSLWTLTHGSDFAKGLVGLLGLPQSIGHAFHITSDEVLNWNQIYRIIGHTLGVEPKLRHFSSETLATLQPECEGTLLGDKALSVVFDNTKIRRFVPDYVATTPFAMGIRQTLGWFHADPARQTVDPAAATRWDQWIAARDRMVKALRELGGPTE